MDPGREMEGRRAGGHSARGRRGRRTLISAWAAISCAALFVGCAASTTSSSPVLSAGNTASIPSSQTPFSTPTPVASVVEIAGSVEAFCALVEPTAIERLLGEALVEQRTERSPSGGAACSYSSGQLDTGEGSFALVSFDRDANLDRWRPGRGYGAAVAYAQRRTELRAADPGQELTEIGLRAWQGSLGSALALFPPDVLVEVAYDPRTAPPDAALGLLRAVGTGLAAGVPADLGPVEACTLIAYDAVQAASGVFVDEVDGFDPFDAQAAETELPPGGATGCTYLGPDPVDPLGVAVALDVVRYRTAAIRTWLRSDASIGIATNEQRAVAADMDAAGWVVSFFVGEPVVVADACQAAWSDPFLFVMIDPDDVVVLRVPTDAGQGVASRLGAQIVAAALSQSAAASQSPRPACGPLGAVPDPRSATFGAVSTPETVT